MGPVAERKDLMIFGSVEQYLPDHVVKKTIAARRNLETEPLASVSRVDRLIRSLSEPRPKFGRERLSGGCTLYRLNW
jgi:hypothetical protein